MSNENGSRYVMMSNCVPWKDMTREQFVAHVVDEGLTVLPAYLVSQGPVAERTRFWRMVHNAAEEAREAGGGMRIRYGTTDTGGSFKARSGGFLLGVGVAADDAQCAPMVLRLQGAFAMRPWQGSRGGTAPYGSELEKPKWNVQLAPADGSTTLIAIRLPADLREMSVVQRPPATPRQLGRRSPPRRGETTPRQSARRSPQRRDSTPARRI